VKMAPPHQPLLTPPVSQARSSQKLPSPDSAEWLLAHERRLHALELQREKVRDIEQKRQVVEQQRLELQRGKVDVLEQKEKVWVLERQARQDLREKIRERGRQRLLDDDAAKRLEVRRVKAQLEAERGERSRLNSLAIVQQTQETWRLQEEARATKQRGQKALRDEADMRAGAQLKRPATTQVAIDSSPKRTNGRQSRYVGLV
jgi:hypothetical protein